MTDSSNITESSQQNGKEKLHANPSVSAQEVMQSKNTTYFLSSLQLRALSGYAAVSYPHSYKNYSFSTVSQNLLVSKHTDKNASTQAVSCLGCFSLKHTFYLLCSVSLQKLFFMCILLICIYLLTVLLKIWTFSPLV